MLLATLPPHARVSASDSIPSIPGTAMTMQEVQEEIYLMKNLTLTLCKDFRATLGGDPAYVVRLACALAKRQHNCLCVPKQEHIPVINDGNIEKFNKYDPCVRFAEELKAVSSKVEATANKPSLQQKFAGN